MSNSDENRGDATYMLFLSSVRPVQEENGVAVKLHYDEYRAAQLAVRWVQRSGKKSMPLLRLIKETDKPKLSVVGFNQLIKRLPDSSTPGFPQFSVEECDFSPVQFETPVILSVDKALKKTKKAMRELSNEQ